MKRGFILATRISLVIFILVMGTQTSYVFAESVPQLIYKTHSNLCIFDYPPALGDNGLLYAMAGTTCGGGTYGIVAFDPTEGSIVWGPIIPSGCSNFSFAGASVGENGFVYAAGDWNECGNGRLVAFNGNNGSIIWDHGECSGSPHPRQTPALDESIDSVYFGSSSLCSVEMDSSVNNWSQSGGYYIGSAGIAIDSTGNVYYSTYNGTGGSFRLRSYSANGTFRWQKDFPNINIQAICSDDLIILTGKDPEALMAFDKNGNALWEIINLTRPVTDEAGAIYASNITGGDVVSLDKTGRELWRRTLPGVTWAKVDFVDNTGHVYVRGNNKLYAINTSNGSVDWSFAADVELNVGTVLVPGGHIFISDSNSNLYLLDTSLEYAASVWPIAKHGNRRHTQKVGDILPLPPPTLSTWVISGTVTGAVQTGVTITLSGSDSGTTTTDSSGNYSFTGLSNGTYTITPSKSGYTFTPTSRTITINGANQTNQNFTASAVNSDDWDYPVWPYVPGSYNGRTFFYDNNHLGEDEALPEGTPIYAIGNGQIKKYGPASGYGELVAVVEHNLGETYQFINAYGDSISTRYILSIYGHLRKSQVRGGTGTGLKVGDLVTGDTVIGYINDDQHNGEGAEHLHMGIRLSDADTAISRDPRAWYRGYERNTTFGTDFAAASEVIEILQSKP